MLALSFTLVVTLTVYQVLRLSLFLDEIPM